MTAGVGNDTDQKGERNACISESHPGGWHEPVHSLTRHLSRLYALCEVVSFTSTMIRLSQLVTYRPVNLPILPFPKRISLWERCTHTAG